MKKVLISVFLLFFAVILTAEETGSISAKMPAWVTNEGLVTSEKVCAAVGRHINDKKFFTKYVRDVTDLARLELAKSITTGFDAMWKHFESSCSTNKYSCDSFVKKDATYARIVTAVKASPRENLWDDGNDVWALVCMQKERYDAAVLGRDFDPSSTNDKADKALKEKELENGKIEKLLIEAADQEWKELGENLKNSKKQ